MKTVMQKMIMNYQTDSFNIVHHARYLELLEEGRLMYCFENNLINEFHNKGIYHVIVNINIDYRSSATFGDLVTVSTELSKVTERSILFKQTVLRNKIILVEADITNVFLHKINNSIISAKEMESFWDDLKLFHNL